MSAPTRPRERVLYGDWIVPVSPGLGVLNVPATVVAIVGGVASVLVILVTGSFPIGLVGIVLTGAVVAPMAWKFEGRSGYEVALLWHRFRTSKKNGENMFRSGIFSRSAGGSTRLPGVMANSALLEFTSAGGRKFGVIHLPKSAEYTVVFKCFPQGGEALDQDEIDRAVAAWGGFLANLGQDGDIVAATATIETVPATGKRVLNEVLAIADPSAPQLAREFMAQSVQQLSATQLETHARLALTFRATTDARRRDPEEQGKELRRRLPGLMTQLSMARVNAREMTAAEITEFVRRAYDPAAQVDLERGLSESEGHGVEWSDAGPVSAENLWTHYVHDGGESVSWEMAAPPSGSVTENVLRPLLAPHPTVPRKRVSIIYRPHSAEETAKIVDADYKNARAKLTGTQGLAKASAEMHVASTKAAREAEARGHGLCRFGVMLTVTEPHGGDLPAVEAVIKALSTQSRLRVRRCHGFHDAAFAAGLGIGMLTNEHAVLPSVLAG